MKKKVLVSSILTIALCVCLIAGSTYALFTSTATTNIAVTAGKVKVAATIDETSVKAWSLLETKPTANDKLFANGGNVEVVDGELKINRMTPGDKVEFTIDVTNSSDVLTQYKLTATSTLPEAETDADGNALPQVDLFPALTITATIGNETLTLQGNTTEAASDWFEGAVAAAENADLATITVTVEFPNNGNPNVDDNVYQGAVTSVSFAVFAVQANGVDNDGNLIQ